MYIALWEAAAKAEPVQAAVTDGKVAVMGKVLLPGGKVVLPGIDGAETFIGRKSSTKIWETAKRGFNCGPLGGGS